MENSPENNQQSISWWITSLAISIACCAVLFVIFAGYLTSIKREISAENMQLEQMAVHQETLLVELRALQHSLGQPTPSATVAAPTTAPVAPPAVQPPAMPTVEEPSITPPAVTAPTGTTAPTVTTPAPVAPTAIPEVPAKK